MQDSPPSIVFLGDSCTQFGSYPRLLIEELEGLGSGAEVLYADLGVAGWSSYQGLHQFQRDVLPLRPSVVTVYFGWNDHWRGFKIEDKQIPRLKEKLLWKFRKSRIIQMVMRGYMELRAKGASRIVRVRPQDFHRNLASLVRDAKKVGIVPVLLTAPTSHTRGDEPAYLEGRFLQNLDDLVPLHQEYVEIVRTVASEEGAILCDLELSFAALPEKRRKEKCFESDGIHLTGQGNRLIADELFASLEKHGLVSLILERSGSAERVSRP